MSLMLWSRPPSKLLPLGLRLGTRLQEKKVEEKKAPGKQIDIMAGDGGPSYTNPPSFLDTITKREPEDPDKVNPLGDNRLALAVGTAVLGAILIFSSVDMGGSDPMTSKQV